MSLCLVIRWCWSSMALWLDRFNIKIIRSTYTLLSLALFLSISSWAHTMYAVCGMLLELCLPNLLLFCYLDQFPFNCCKHLRQKTKNQKKTTEQHAFHSFLWFSLLKFDLSSVYTIFSTHLNYSLRFIVEFAKRYLLLYCQNVCTVFIAFPNDASARFVPFSLSIFLSFILSLAQSWVMWTEFKIYFFFINYEFTLSILM